MPTSPRRPQMYGVNRLDAAVLTASPDGPEPGQPVTRVADRDIGLRTTDLDAVGTREWHADLGIDPGDVMFAIFLGYGVAGETIVLESSDDDAAWDARGAVVMDADGVPKRLTVLSGPVVARYWRWTVTDPLFPVAWTEVFLTPAGVELTRNPNASAMREPLIANVAVVTSVSGRSWPARRGPRKWSGSYLMSHVAESDRQVLFDFLDAIDDGAKPFWLWTATLELRWVLLNGSIDLIVADGAVTNWDMPLQFVEELP